MNPNDILQTTKFTTQSLEKLRTDYEKLSQCMIDLIEVIPSNEIDAKLQSVKTTINQVEIDVDRTEISAKLSQYLQYLESENEELNIQMKFLCQENTWLRDELGSTQKQLHDSEQIHGSYLNELEDLKFLKDVKLFDSGYENSNDQMFSDNQIDFDDQSIDEQDLVNDLFPSDNDSDDEIDETDYPVAQDTCMESPENHVNDANRLVISSSQMNDPFIAANGYEMPPRLKALYNIVIEYTSQGRFEIAIPLCRQAIDDLETTFGYQHPDVATMLNILALVYRDQSNLKEASSLLYEALAIREATLGRDHLAVAVLLNNLAILNSKRNRLQDAEVQCKRAVDIRRKSLGSSHPDVAKQLNNLALICQQQGKYEVVEMYFQDIIDIYTENYGANDTNVTKTKNSLASVYLKQRKYFEAEQLYTDILRCACYADIKSSRRSSSTSLSSSSLPNKENNSYDITRMHTPIVTTTLNSLSLLYRRQGQSNTAKLLEHYASDNDYNPQGIIQLLDKIT